MTVLADQNGEVLDGTAVEVYQAPPPAGLFRTDDPVEVIEKATKVANALKAVVVKQGLITTIKGREHPRVEAWQTLGAMLGVFPVKEWVRPLPWPSPVPGKLRDMHDRGMTFGFEASFVAQRPDGAILGGGEAACMRTETKWCDSDDYAVRSMAQTRATSKALSAPLRFVMSLAGFETTPAEEMEGQAARSSGAQSGASGTQSPQPSARPPAPSDRPASAADRRLIQARASNADLTPAVFANVILTAIGEPKRDWQGHDDAAGRWINRQLDRLPARHVGAVLAGIDDVVIAAADGGTSR